MAKVVRKKRKAKKNIPNGVVHIHSTYNNTIITFADEMGNVIAWSSAGANGFKGSKKSTPFAAQLSAEAATKAAMENGMKEVRAELKGRGPGKDAAVKQIQVSGIAVTSIKDVTPVAHNGCRPPKSKMR